MPAVNVDKRFNHLAKMFRRRELPSMLDITVKQRGPLKGFETGFPVLEAASVRIVAARKRRLLRCQAQSRTCKIGIVP